MSNDTIFALASGRPPAAIAIVRLSGPVAHEAGRRLAGTLPEPRQAALRPLRDPGDGSPIDEALLLRFDGPLSATGDDVIEFHCHGSRAVVDALLVALGKMEGLRQAEPGEFTRRAFANGRIDLTEAEGLADLLEAETESQRKAALAMAEGGLKRQIADWRLRLVELSARAEAAIDYVGEDETGIDSGLQRDCGSLASELRDWLSRPRAEPLKNGVRVVVAGPPNAGKSSLINAIAGSERAIVTDIPGTTRDHIEVPMAVAGVPILLTDTAGLRDSNEPVEQLGIARARELAVSADILVWLGQPDEAPAHPRLVQVRPKCDLPERGKSWDTALLLSAVTGEGISELLTQIADLARQMLPEEDTIALNRRQAECLETVATSLEDADVESDIVLAAESLRHSRMALDRLNGQAGVEDVLDALFGRFCLGK